MASPSYWCRGSWNWNGLCWWWLSQIVQEYYSGHRFVTWWSIEWCAINDRLAAHHINDEPWTLAVSFDGWNLWWHVIGVGMYWPDPGWKEKQFKTIVFPKQVTLSFSNFRSSNQVWNGIPIIPIFWKLKWFTFYVARDSPNCAGRSFRWSIRLVQHDKWQGLLVRCCPESFKTNFHIKS